MEGIRTDIKTKWKNYVIKADAERARYHKVEYGKESLYHTVAATGLKPRVKYTFSARVRMNIQQTSCQTVLNVYGLNKYWYDMGKMKIAANGDMDVFVSTVITPPKIRPKKQNG